MTHKLLDVADALDLSVRARRGELDADAQRELERAVESSGLVRTAHETGRSFDVASEVHPGDEALVLRAANQALSASSAPWRKRGSRAALGLAATLLVASAGAATAVVVVQRGRQPEPQRQAPVEAARPGSPARVASTAARSPDDHARPAEDATSSGTAAKSAPSRPSANANANAPGKDKTASSLFLEASAARRAGDFGAARTLYLELQARFPGTNEARVSLVSLGKLLLSAGKARAAEQAFGTYLKGGAGDLGEEALVGRASALAALGEGGEERRTWRELLSKYPSSIYRARAETRIDELDSARRVGRP